MLVYPMFQAVEDFIEYLFSDKRTKKIKRSVPYTCQHCELLGICRDEFNGWKCKHGCLVINEERKRGDKK